MTRRILALTLFITSSLFKERANYLLLFFAALSSLLTLSISSVDIAMRFKLFEDLLLSSQNALLIVASLFYTFTLLQKERDMGLFIITLSSGVSRFEYEVAIFKSIGSTLFALFLIFFAFDVVLLFGVEGELRWSILLQLLLYSCGSMMLGFTIIAFSRFVSVMNASLYGVILYIIGNALDELLVYATKSGDIVFAFIADVLYIVLPNYSLFDIQSLVVNHADIDGMMVAKVFGYFVLYSWFLLFVSFMRFKNKALKVGH
jgi:hypothetical protein